MEKRAFHLIVEEGPDKGLELTIPADGARVGRSSNNDIVLKDPVMSRFHCRFFFKQGQGLWAEDLGSANETMVNGAPLREAQVHTGDRITMGDTTLKVVDDHPPEPLHKKLFDRPSTGRHPGSIEVLRPPEKEQRKPLLTVVLLILACLVALVTAGIWIVKIFRPVIAPPPAVTTHRAQPLEIAYEKIQASPDNIFRYEMELINNELSIQIDDLKNERHVPKDQHKRVDPEFVQNLVDFIENSGFLEMKEEYTGRASTVWDVLDLSVTIGTKTHRVTVLNRIEPDEFKNIRETIEEFGRNELGLAALALSHEKLMELAHDTWLLGQSLYDQRQVKNENLAQAIRSLKEMEWYLETIEPKPDYYADSIALLGECEREQQEIYEQQLFLANRAIKLKDWAEAASQLRTLCEKIPDRSDERHKDARKKLIDVERRLKKDKR